MVSNRLALAALGVACVAAAGAGGYLASSQSAPAVQPPIAAAAPATSAESPVAVTETEGVLGDVPQKTTSETSNAAGHGIQAEAPEALHKAAPVAAPHAAAQSPAPKAQTTGSHPQTPSTASPVSQQAHVNQPAPAPFPAPQAAPAPPPPPPAPVADRFPSTREPEPVREPEVFKAPEPPVKQEKEFVVSTGTVVGLKLDSMITSERAKVEDRVDARVTRDVRVGNDVVIPSGAKAIGSVVSVDPGGKAKGRAKLGIRFHTLVLADGTRLPITTETIYRTGEDPGNVAAAKVGGSAVAGAILGAIMGGAKGAAIGGTVGAGAGTTAVMTADRKAATFPSGTEVNSQILYPVTVTIEK